MTVVRIGLAITFRSLIVADADVGADTGVTAVLDAVTTACVATLGLIWTVRYLVIWQGSFAEKVCIRQILRRDVWLV